MKFISLDLEFTQPSGTIIQIGASVWDTDQNKEIAMLSMYVNPDEEINWDYDLQKAGMTLGDLLPFDHTEIIQWFTKNFTFIFLPKFRRILHKIKEF